MRMLTPKVLTTNRTDKKYYDIVRISSIFRIFVSLRFSYRLVCPVGTNRGNRVRIADSTRCCNPHNRTSIYATVGYPMGRSEARVVSQNTCRNVLNAFGNRGVLLFYFPNPISQVHGDRDLRCVCHEHRTRVRQDLRFCFFTFYPFLSPRHLHLFYFAYFVEPILKRAVWLYRLIAFKLFIKYKNGTGKTDAVFS